MIEYGPLFLVALLLLPVFFSDSYIFLFISAMTLLCGLIYLGTLERQEIGKINCEAGYIFIKGEKDYIQVLDKNGHGIPCKGEYKQ